MWAWYTEKAKSLFNRKLVIQWPELTLPEFMNDANGFAQSLPSVILPDLVPASHTLPVPPATYVITRSRVRSFWNVSIEAVLVLQTEK